MSKVRQPYIYNKIICNHFLRSSHKKTPGRPGVFVFQPKPLAADVRPTVSAGGERQESAYSSVTIPCTANVTGLSDALWRTAIFLKKVPGCSAEKRTVKNTFPPGCTGLRSYVTCVQSHDE